MRTDLFLVDNALYAGYTEERPTDSVAFALGTTINQFLWTAPFW